eukprot:3975071-Amphidinium_carterae.1
MFHHLSSKQQALISIYAALLVYETRLVPSASSTQTQNIQIDCCNLEAEIARAKGTKSEEPHLISRPHGQQNITIRLAAATIGVRGTHFGYSGGASVSE